VPGITAWQYFCYYIYTEVFDEYTVCLRKTGPLQLISHNFTSLKRSLIILVQRYLIQFSIDYDKKFLNWLRTSCVVSITIIATRHTTNSGFLGWLQTTYRRQGNKRVAKRLWGCVNAELQHWNTCCNFWYRKTFIITRETLFV